MECPGNFLNRICFVVLGGLLSCYFSHLLAIPLHERRLIRKNNYTQVRRVGSSLGKLGFRTDYQIQKRQKSVRSVGDHCYFSKNERLQLLRKLPGFARVRTVEKEEMPFLPAVYLRQSFSFRWPIKRGNFWISTYYGKRSRGRLHAGLDLAAANGTPVYASANGRIEYANEAGTFGNMILIKHDNNFKSRYAHLHKIVVHKKKFVQKGELLGYVGNTGNVSGKNGNHLHFEILSRNGPINPIKVLS